MKIIRQPVLGKLLIDGDRAAILLNDPTSEESGEQVYLAYALITQGPGNQILPVSLLDDWGNEIKKLELYRWIHENGMHFPRAEVFGFSPTGESEQYFLRDLELIARHPVYAFVEADDSVSSGVLLQAVLIADSEVEHAQPINPPDDISLPLREARVSWWQVNPRQVDLGFLA
jgi:hypothetical protein